MTGRARTPSSPVSANRFTDHELMAAMSRGDHDALAELYDRHGRLAYGVALHITQDAMLAQDAVQEAFLQIWRGAAAVDRRRTSITAWVVLLARRRAIDLTRGHVRSARTPPVHERDAPAAEEQALTNLESRRARAALKTLTPEQLDVIQLAYYRGLSQSEIATERGIPIGTVKSRTHSALQDLRVALSDGDALAGGWVAAVAAVGA